MLYFASLIELGQLLFFTAKNKGPVFITDTFSCIAHKDKALSKVYQMKV